MPTVATLRVFPIAFCSIVCNDIHVDYYAIFLVEISLFDCLNEIDFLPFIGKLVEGMAGFLQIESQGPES